MDFGALLAAAAVNTLMSAGVNRAVNGGGGNSTSSRPVDIPQLAPQPDPWDWFAKLMSKNQRRDI